MTRKKKTRKEQSIGAGKKPLEKLTERLKDTKKKKSKGRPAGAKANIDGVKVKKSPSKGGNAKTQDARVGSKKAIELVPQAVSKPLEPKKIAVKKRKPEPKLSVEQQLSNIENDERLNGLLDKLDDGIEISAKDQAYIDHQTAAHQKLMALVDDNDEPEEKKEAWEQIDSSEFDEFKSK
ncbi:MAG: Der GTPase-activating protein YihI [Psychrobium sp.]